MTLATGSISAELPYLHLFLPGLYRTIIISLGAMAIGTTLGLLSGAARASSVRWLRWITTGYVEVIRSIPLLILLFLAYYALPILFPSFSPSVLLTAVIAQGIYLGAYMTEIVRTGLQGVPPGQWEASRALGLSYTTSMRRVILPQALVIATPPAVSQLMASVKESSLASAIGVVEITQTATVIRQQTLSAWTPLITMAVLYLFVNLLVALGGRKLEIRLMAKERMG